MRSTSETSSLESIQFNAAAFARTCSADVGYRGICNGPFPESGIAAKLILLCGRLT
jgi:hypothetical protein